MVIINAFAASETINNTYLVFTSDHGELAMEHRQYYKMSYYDGSSRVPLLITGPGVTPKIVKDPTQLIDLFPTFMDIAGVAPPPLLNGTSLMPLLNSEVVTYGPRVRPDYVLSQYHGCHANTSFYMLRTGSYKYIAFGDGVIAPPQLFNMEEDPAELNNLVPSDPQTTAVLEKLLRSIIDYPAVTAEVEAYNRATFAQWKEAQGKQYSQVLENLTWFWDWSRDPQGNELLIDNWLNTKIK